MCIFKYYMYLILYFFVPCQTLKKKLMKYSNLKKNRHLETCYSFNDIMDFFKRSPFVEHRAIDIVVPVYNGNEFLDDLFMSIYKYTSLDYRLYVVNDKSTDPKVLETIKKYQELFGDIFIYLENEENLGFLKTCNRGLQQASHDVVILNTDVRVSKGWAERLFYPIFQNDKVASVTPFSNAATIFSVPVIFEDNTLDVDHQMLDDSLSVLNIRAIPYLQFPTGVGFCMAMSKKALDEIGLFDEKFGRGYGEENDWCMRAIQAGFINTLAYNLFIWHKHGGTFQSEEKKQLCKEHMLLLTDTFPNYHQDVIDAINNKDFKFVRFFAELMYFLCRSEASVVLKISRKCGACSLEMVCGDFTDNLMLKNYKDCMCLINYIKEKKSVEIVNAA